MANEIDDVLAAVEGIAKMDRMPGQPPADLLPAVRLLAGDRTRLRALIKAAEWADNLHDANACPWCTADRLADEKHTAKCPAFTPEGEVR